GRHGSGRVRSVQSCRSERVDSAHGVHRLRAASPCEHDAQRGGLVLYPSLGLRQNRRLMVHAAPIGGAWIGALRRALTVLLIVCAALWLLALLMQAGVVRRQ